MITKADWQDVQEHLMDEGRRRAGDPPTAGELLAYTRGELSSTEEDRIRELLVHHPELARMAAEPFPTEGAEPGDADFMSEHELARHWTSFQGRRNGASEGRLLQFWRASAALAAALALVFGGLLWKEWSDAGSARAGWEVSMLSPDGQRGPSTGGVTLTGKGNSYGLVAMVGADPRYDDYRAEIVDADGKKIWSQTLPGRGESENLSLLVPRSFLKPGKYQLVLFGVDGAREEKLVTYTVRVPRS